VKFKKTLLEKRPLVEEAERGINLSCNCAGAAGRSVRGAVLKLFLPSLQLPLCLPHQLLAMEKITPFDIPLLNNEICQYLSREDLARCVLVSKVWSAWFFPALWRDLDCRNKKPDTLILTRQRGHIRGVRNISMECARVIREQLGTLDLRRLEFKKYFRGLGVHRAEIRVLPVLERITTLQHLQVSLSLDRDNIYQQWIRTLEALPHLESLCLTCVRFVEGKAIQGILTSCCRFVRLSLEFSDEDDGVQEEDEQEYRGTKAVIEQIPEMRLRELAFLSGINLVEENILQPLLERCPRMEKLDLGWIRHDSTLRHLSKTLKENKLPKLRHLTMGGLYDSHFQAAFAEMLPHVEFGMQSLVFHNSPTEALTQSLILNNSSSLTNLDFDYPDISLGTVSKLMAGLPNLQSFNSTIQAYYYTSEAVPVDRHWECVNLKNLRLRLRGYSSSAIGGSRWIGSRQKIYLDYVFSEVAKLACLQELIIGCDLKNMYLKKHGYLARLADLKQLKVFDLANTSHKTFGKQEALWMIKNWPKLLQVYEPGAPEIFRETLLAKRPLVEIITRRHY